MWPLTQGLEGYSRDPGSDGAEIGKMITILTGSGI